RSSDLTGRGRHNGLDLGLRRRLHAVDLELIDDLRLVDVLQVPLSEGEDPDTLGKRGAEQGPRRGREQDLTAAAARAETCRADDVEADVAGVAHRRLSRVQSDPDADDGALGPFVL